jgi:hypothetical protein
MEKVHSKTLKLPRYALTVFKTGNLSEHTIPFVSLTTRKSERLGTLGRTTENHKAKKEASGH